MRETIATTGTQAKLADTRGEKRAWSAPTVTTVTVPGITQAGNKGAPTPADLAACS